MLQIANLELYTEQDIPRLLGLIQPILAKRKELHEKYTRGANQAKTMYSNSNKNTVMPLEMIITDLAAGYNAGTPIYRVDISKDKDKNEIIRKYLNKEIKEDNYAKAMEVLIDYIANYNDDKQENYDLLHDLFEMTACYEYIYEDENNEIVYSKFDPLQVVATWDYSIPANLTGFVRKWEEKDINGNTIVKVQTIDKEKICTYDVLNSSASIIETTPHVWGDVPGFAVETDFSIFEPSEDAIRTYEQLIQNIRNTHEYNDSLAKLKIKGYRPTADLLTQDESGNWIPNPKREAEDSAILKAKTFYVEPDGDVDWILKPTDDAGSVEILKVFSDASFQLSSIPNTTDLAFNSRDLNASAIDRKFFVMDINTSKINSMLCKAYLRRWELIFNRINFKKKAELDAYKFDFRDIRVEIPKNLPPNNSEKADYLLKLDGKLSTQTQLEALGYDYYSEKERLNREASDNMMANMERLMGGYDEPDTEEMETDRQDTEELSSEVSE